MNVIDHPSDNEPLALIHGIPLEDEAGLGALTLPAFLLEVTARYAKREALVMYQADKLSERWTYAQLWERALEVARALISTGIGKGSRVGLLMTNRLEWVSACFGITMTGAAVVGLSTFSTALELEFLLRSAEVSVLLFERQVLAKDFLSMLKTLEPAIGGPFTDGWRSEKFPTLTRLIMLSDGPATGMVEGWQDFLSQGSQIDPGLVLEHAAAVSRLDPALLFFSSGSTGRPKGILNSHQAVNIQSWRWVRIYAFDHPVRTWSANGLFWSGNFTISLGATLAAGGALVLQRTFNPAEALSLMQDERVTLPYCWPHQWAQLEAEPPWDNADLSSFYYMDVERNLHRPQKSLAASRLDPRASYGSTETFTISTAYPVNSPYETWQGSSGEALPGNTLKIVDPASGAILRRGETGEIAVKGPTLMLGYLGVPPEESLDADGFYRSGDGGYIDSKGRLYFSGRINDIIKTGGANVSPVEVDWTLCSCPGIKVCKTTGVPHDTLGEMVVSLVVPEPGRHLTPQDVIGYLKPQLASYKIPRRVIFVEESELNFTGTSKVKSAEARALAQRKLQELSDNGLRHGK